MPKTPKETAQTRVQWRGVWITARMRDALRYAERMLQHKFPGLTILPAQGSWSTSVAASGTTHAGAGVIDIRTIMLTVPQVAALMRCLKDSGLLPFRREKIDGFDPHIHCLDRVTTGMSSSAKGQVVDYDKGLNGLNDHKRDRFTYRVEPKLAWSYPAGQPVAA